jgi:hypothetical protein
MAISHADHDHPNTPAARAACRKQMGRGDVPLTGNPVPAGGVAGRMAAALTVVPRRRGDGGVVRGMKAAAPKTLKKPNTKIKNIGDLTDMPQMLAYAVRLAWQHDDLQVVVGDPFNDHEANIVIKGPAAHITCIWRVSQPNGIYAMRIRPVDSSKGAGDATSAQQAVDIARGVEPIPNR